MRLGLSVQKVERLLEKRRRQMHVGNNEVACVLMQKVLRSGLEKTPGANV